MCALNRIRAEFGESVSIPILLIILIQFSLPAGERDSLRKQLDGWQLSLEVRVPAIGINVRLLREEELEETHLLIPTGQVDTQQHEVLAQSGFGEFSVSHLTIIGKPLHGVLRVIVVPGNAIMVQKGE